MDIKHRFISAYALGIVTAAMLSLGVAQQTRLQTQAEIFSVCSYMQTPEDAKRCELVLNGNRARGRGEPLFRLVRSQNKTDLQSRSGVLFKSRFNDLIKSVIVDSTHETRVRLSNGAECVVWVGNTEDRMTPLDDPKMLSSAIRLYGDQDASLKRISKSELGGKQAVLFEADNQRGAYIDDSANNAGIWITCLGQDRGLSKATNHLLGTVIGSSKKF
ncbi:hypothetical protein [Azonexus hydrophilus]|uniref:Uncharacterized protein n=1 Tax=Azonexus hydrophilus TaxID=418702 RepID=A0ABZ2XLG6_9RHOO